NELSLKFQQQDDVARKTTIAGLIRELKQTKRAIDERIKALDTLVENVERKQADLAQKWKAYEAQQKTVLPHIQKQQKQQKTEIDKQLATIIQQKNVLALKLDRKRNAIQQEIANLEAARTEDGYEPIKMCNWLIAFYQDQLNVLMCKKQERLKVLTEQKNALFVQWKALENEAKNNDQKDQQLITLIPSLEETIHASIQALTRAKDRLKLQKKAAEEKIATIRAYDDEAAFNYRPINQAIHALDQDIAVLMTKRQYVNNRHISCPQAKTAKKSLIKTLLASDDHLEALPLPTLQSAEGAFNQYQQQINELNHNVHEAHATKQTAMEKLQRELDDFIQTTILMSHNELPTDNLGDLEQSSKAEAAINFFEGIAQVINHDKDIQLTNIDAILNEAQKNLDFCELKALPKKRAQLCTHIDDILKAHTHEPTDIYKLQIHDAFYLYKNRIIGTRREILDTSDFLLNGDEKKGYLNNLREIHASFQGSLETELDKLESEEKVAHKEPVAPISEQIIRKVFGQDGDEKEKEDSLKTSLSKLESDEKKVHEQFVLGLNAQKDKLSAKITKKIRVTPSCPHPAKGWAGETRFLIASTTIKPMVKPTEEQTIELTRELTVEETANIERNIEKLTNEYLAQKKDIANQRTALYTAANNTLDRAITGINTVSNDAKVKIAQNQRALAHVRRGIFYTAAAISIASPVCVGIFEGLVAGFVAGMATGVVGLPFWLIAGAIGGGAVGVSVSVGSAFFAHKAKQVALNNLPRQRNEMEKALESDVKNSEFNITCRN
ncbi:MAG: hypothetical protein K2Q14_00860, partial [Gammaproteobacteria bacterium]|nr:hypothetical protein [Gammaproteobacteria bacterium]